ncbi:hypothetical protein [Pseudonocardia sp. EC080619-01]|uniref:hypothetical protein n=1 Tax=Pseudonocardia sp. EC080619-01 TaxID=1096856 RepID=UPI0011AEAC4F|nr:hypothetical protein [Pseudonocardia sp. EC080619-01]
MGGAGAGGDVDEVGVGVERGEEVGLAQGGDQPPGEGEGEHRVGGGVELGVFEVVLVAEQVRGLVAPVVVKVATQRGLGGDAHVLGGPGDGVAQVLLDQRPRHLDAPLLAGGEEVIDQPGELARSPPGAHATPSHRPRWRASRT